VLTTTEEKTIWGFKGNATWRITPRNVTSVKRGFTHFYMESISFDILTMVIINRFHSRWICLKNRFHHKKKTVVNHKSAPEDGYLQLSDVQTNESKLPLLGMEKTFKKQNPKKSQLRGISSNVGEHHHHIKQVSQKVCCHRPMHEPSHWTPLWVTLKLVHHEPKKTYFPGL